VDGDKLEISWTGYTNYTPTTSPTEADSLDDLTAHLAGINTALGAGGAHALLSAVHTDTLPAAVSRGSLVYGNSTPAWAELVVGGSGTVLTSDGTDLSWASAAGGSLDTSYDFGGAGSGRSITADSGALQVKDVDLGATADNPHLLDCEYTASGTLTAYTANMVELALVRTESGGATLTDAGVLLKVTQTAVSNHVSSNYILNNVLVSIESSTAETLGNLTDNTCLLELIQDPDATASQVYIRCLEAGDTRNRLEIIGDGGVRWGPGGAGATDTWLSRTAAGVLDLTSILDVNTGFRIAGAAAAGSIFKGNGTNFVGLARGSANEYLKVNSGATDLAYEALDITDDPTFTRGTSPHGSPSDGDLFFDTADHVLYSYDSTRAKWLGPMEQILFGRNGSVSDDSWLKQAGNVIADGAASGPWLPFDYTIVGYSWTCASAPGTGTSICSVERGTTQLFTFDISNGGVGTQTEDQTINADFTTDANLGLHLENMTTSLCGQPTCIIYLRRRTS